MEATILHSTYDDHSPEQAAILVASFTEGGATGLSADAAIDYFNHYGSDETVKTALGYLRCAVLLQDVTFFQLLALRAVTGFKAHGLGLDPSMESAAPPDDVEVEHLNTFMVGMRGTLEAYETMVNEGASPEVAIHVLCGGVPVSSVVSFDLWSLIETSGSISIRHGNAGGVIALIRRRVENRWPWVKELELWNL